MNPGKGGPLYFKELHVKRIQEKLISRQILPSSCCMVDALNDGAVTGPLA